MQVLKMHVFQTRRFICVTTTLLEKVIHIYFFIYIYLYPGTALYEEVFESHMDSQANYVAVKRYREFFL